MKESDLWDDLKQILQTLCYAFNNYDNKEHLGIYYGEHNQRIGSQCQSNPIFKEECLKFLEKYKIKERHFRVDEIGIKTKDIPKFRRDFRRLLYLSLIID